MAGTALGMAAPAQAAAGVDLTVGTSQVGRFAVGQQGTLVVKVSNIGTVASTGEVKVETGLREVYTLESFSGAGWSCSSSTDGQYSSVQCRRTQPVAPGTSLPDISVVVTPLSEAYSPDPGGQVLVGTVVTNDSDGNRQNNADEFAPIVDGAAVGISADVPDQLDVSAVTTVPVTVTNRGTLPGRGRITVDAYGGNSVLTASGSGAGWQCDQPPPSPYFLSCSHSFTIDAGQSLPVLSLSLRALDQAYPKASFNLFAAGDADGDTYTGKSFDYHEFTVTGVADLSVLGGLAFTSQPATAGTVEPVTVTITNVGTVASTGGITVKFPTDSGGAYTVVSGTGDGWSCATQASPVVCSRPGTLGAHQRAPLLTAGVQVGTSAYSSPTTPGSPLSVHIDNGDGTDPKSYPQLNNNNAMVRPVVDGVQDLAIDTPHPSDATVAVGSTLVVPLSISAVGGKDVSGATTVTARLRPGITLVSSSGPGWTCRVATCTRTAPVAAGAPVPLTLSLQFDRSQIRGRQVVDFQLENSQQVYNNNEQAHVAPLVRPGLNLAASFRAKAEGRVQPGRGVLFNLGVTNVGSQPGIGTTTVTYTVPDGLQYLSSTSGPNFSCSKSGDTLTCTRSGHLPLGVRVVAAVIRGRIAPATVPATVTQCTQVTHDGDIDAGNDQACADYVVTPQD